MSNPLSLVPCARPLTICKKNEDYICDEALDIQFSMRNISFVPFILWTSPLSHTEMYHQNIAYLKSIGYRVFLVKSPEKTLSGSKNIKVYIIANPLDNIIEIIKHDLPNELFHEL